MGSDEIMPELLCQQNPGSLGEGGWREGGWSCWESGGEITPPSSVTLAPGLQGDSRGVGQSQSEMCPGWNCVHEAGIRVRELGDAQSAGQQGWKGWERR